MEWERRGPFTLIEGMIVEMMPARDSAGNPNGCNLYFTLEDDDGNTATFLVNRDTYVLDGITLRDGMRAGFWYDTDAPVPLIDPPQYVAIAAAQMGNERMVDVSRYDEDLINAEQTLQIRPDRFTTIETTNGQMYFGNLADHDLMVVYSGSTRSIPAQTTPMQIIVLCDAGEQGCSENLIRS